MSNLLVIISCLFFSQGIARTKDEKNIISFVEIVQFELISLLGSLN